MSAFPCPVANCHSTQTEVIDTRERPKKIWRRRQCSNGHRFTTTEAARVVPDYSGSHVTPLTLHPA